MLEKIKHYLHPMLRLKTRIQRENLILTFAKWQLTV